MPANAERELERLRAHFHSAINATTFGVPLSEITPLHDGLDALIAAAQRVGAEERDREWLNWMAEDIELGLIREEGFGDYFEMKVFNIAKHWGYEPDGSGGWRKIGGEDD